MFSWPHNCKFDDRKNPKKLTRWQAVKKAIENCFTIHPDNPYSVAKFKSTVAIERERKRQLDLGAFVIHPFSKFKSWYDMFTLFLYVMVLITKPIEFGFTIRDHFEGRYGTCSLILDLLCWVDICVSFFCGYVDRVQKVELNRRRIGLHYVYSPFFFCDVLTSIPRKLLYLASGDNPVLMSVLGTVNILYILKLIRLISVVGFIQNSVIFYSLKRGPAFLQQSMVVLAIISHWLTCMQFGIPRLMRHYVIQSQENETWFARSGLQRAKLADQYFHSAFKSTAYILGIRMTKIYEEKLPEEFIMGALTYFIGKVIVGLMWLIFAVTILNYKSVEIKFAEVINQLNEYLTQKQLPLDLKERILNNYVFKYRKKYLHEEKIASFLSNNLVKDVTLHMCNSLIKDVSLFSELTTDELGKVVRYLVPEIFLPNDTIIQSGTRGDAIYFISSGTVAVYTRSGKEVCHLQEGGYFGEISLIIKGQTRIATVVAIESTQVYRLDRKSFEICLLHNQKVMEALSYQAKERLKMITSMDEEYKKTLYEQTMHEIMSLNN